MAVVCVHTEVNGTRASLIPRYREIFHGSVITRIGRLTCTAPALTFAASSMPRYLSEVTMADDSPYSTRFAIGRYGLPPIRSVNRSREIPYLPRCA